MSLQRVVQRYGRNRILIVIALLVVSITIFTIPIRPASILSTQYVEFISPTDSSIYFGNLIEFTVLFTPPGEPAVALQLAVTPPSGKQEVLDQVSGFYDINPFYRSAWVNPVVNGTYIFRASMIIEEEEVVLPESVDPATSGAEDWDSYQDYEWVYGDYRPISTLFDLVEGEGFVEYYNTFEVTIVGDDGTGWIPDAPEDVSFPSLLFTIMSIGALVSLNKRRKSKMRSIE